MLGLYARHMQRRLLKLALTVALGSAVACSSLLGDFEVRSQDATDASTTPETGPLPDGGPIPEGGPNPDGGPLPTCEAPSVRCGVKCVDLTKNGQSCGRCGHDCGGGACEASVCKAVKIADGPTAIVSIALDANEVFYTSKVSVLACPKSGCTASVLPRTVATMGDETFAISIATGTVAFQAALAAPTGPSIGVYACPSAGCPAVPTLLREDPNMHLRLEAAGDNLVYSAGGTGMEGFRCTGGACVKNLQTSRKSKPVFTTNLAHIYYLENAFPTHIARCPQNTLASCTAVAETIQNDENSLTTAMDLQAGNLYWAIGTQINTCAIGAGASCDGTTKRIASFTDPVIDLRVDGSGAYWITQSTAATQVWKILTTSTPGGAGGVKTLPVLPGSDAHSIRVDDNFVYWAEKTSIWRIAKL